jgi:NTP pyrophosphatase (non-canonical NTP hydrolase)
MPLRQHDILSAIVAERARQEHLKATGHFTYTCADVEMSDADCFLVLGEEVGEVARAVLEQDSVSAHPGTDLCKELTQVAAVCVAWLERLRAQEDPPCPRQS